MARQKHMSASHGSHDTTQGQTSANLAAVSSVDEGRSNIGQALAAQDQAGSEEASASNASARPKKGERTARKTGRISEDKTKSAGDAKTPQIRRRREIKERASFALPNDLLSEEFSALAPSIVLPKTQQELRDIGMTNLYRLSQNLADLIFPNEADPQWDPSWEPKPKVPEAKVLEVKVPEMMVPKAKMPDVKVTETNVQREKQVSAQSQNAAYIINHVLTLPAQPGRDFQCINVECRKIAKDYKYKAWLFTFKSKVDNWTFKSVAMNNIVEGALADAQEALQVGAHICKYLNRWPVPLPSSLGNEKQRESVKVPGAWFWPLVGFAAFFAVKPAHDNNIVPVLPKQLGTKDGVENFGSKVKQSVSIRRARKTWEACAYVAGVIQEDWEQPASSKKVGVQLSLPATVVKGDVDIPETPTWWPKASPDLQKVAAAEKDSVQRCVGLVHWIAFRLHGYVGDQASLQKQITVFKKPFMTKVRSKRSKRSKQGTKEPKTRALGGIYGGKCLLAWRANNKSVSIRLSRSVSNDCAPILLHSLSRTRLTYVQEAITSKFMGGHGVRKSFLHGALVADLLNMGKIGKETIMHSVRSCESKSHAGRPHVCQGCTLLSDCSKMVYSKDGYRLCRKCAESNDINDQILGDGSLDRRVASNTRRDFKATGMSRETLDRHLRLIKKKFDDVFDSTAQAYGDAYAPGIFRKENVIAERADSYRFALGSTPFQATVDARDPIYHDEEDDGLYCHHPNNVVTTANWLNRMKYTWVPPILELIKRYRQLVFELGFALDSPEVQDIMRRLDHVYVIQRMVPRSLKRRLSGSMKSKVGKLRRQMLSALADVTEKPPGLWAVSLRPLVRKTGIEWLPPRLGHVEHIIKQMEEKYGRKVPRVGAQQLPWLWMTRHKIDNFNWRSLYNLIGDRLERLDDYCDAEEDHSGESSDTILLECVRQFLERSGKDGFLGLPMTIFERHPLCFAIAHLVHGKKMRTGFTTPEPKDFYEDYDESLSNISFETQISNYAKHAFYEDLYDSMLEDLKSVEVPQEYYQRSFDVLVEEIAQLSLLNDSSTPEDDENVDSVPDEELESDNEIEENAEDDAVDGEVAEEESDEASSSEGDDDNSGDEAEEAESSDHE